MQKTRVIAAARSLLQKGVPVALGWTKNEQGRCHCPNENCSSPGHHPIGGIYSATLNEQELVSRLTAFTEFLPNLIIATGHPSSNAPTSTPRSPLIGVDIDGREGREQWEALCRVNNWEGITPTVKTGGGGLHLYFLRPPGVEYIRSLSRGGISSHIELKADASSGLTAPPSIHHLTGESYTWEIPLDTPFLVLPDFLWQPFVRSAARATTYDALPLPGTSTAYGLAALQSACDRIAAALPGSQEDTLNRECLSIGNLVAGGEISEEEAISSLFAASRQMVNQEGREPWADPVLMMKVERGLSDGKKNPRQAPPRDPGSPLLNALDRVINELTTPEPTEAEALDTPMREALQHRDFINHLPLDDPETPLETIAQVTHRWPLDKIGLAARIVYWRGANYRMVAGILHHWNGKIWSPSFNRTAGSAHDALYCDVDCLPDLLAAEIPMVGDAEGRDRVRLMGRFSDNMTGGLRKAVMSRPIFITSSEQIDADPLLFNMKNGTFNLATGQLQPHSRKDLITRISPVSYDKSAPCPMWLSYLERVHRDHPENIPYLQRLSGYTLRGDNPAQIMVLLLGEKSRNGKTVFLETLMGIMGNYARPAQGEMMYSDHKYEEDKILYELYQYRMVNFSEPAEKGKYSRRLNTPFLKKITGGDAVSVRAHYEHSFHASIHFKLWCGSNYPLHPDESAVAIWDRLRIVGFHQFLPPEERIPNLTEKLKVEYAGIFNWMIQGWKQYQQMGIGETADAIKLKIQDIEEQNPMMGWMNESCDRDVDHFETTRTLFQSYDGYAKESNLERMTINRFSRLLKKIPGVTEYRTTTTKGVKGLRLIRPISNTHYLDSIGDDE